MVRKIGTLLLFTAAAGAAAWSAWPGSSAVSNAAMARADGVDAEAPPRSGRCRARTSPVAQFRRSSTRLDPREPQPKIYGTRPRRPWGFAAGQAACWGGPWEWRVRPSGAVAVRVPSGWQVICQPQR